MAKDPAFLFYPQDFLTGTMFMTNEQIGIYIILLCAQHQHGGMISKPAFNSLVGNNDILRDKFIEVEDGFFNERLMIEIEKRAKKSTNLSANAKIRWEKEKQKQCKSNAIAYAEHMPIENANENEDVIVISNVNSNKKTLEERMTEFELELTLYKGEYPPEMLDAFYNYWSEPNPSKTKMRKELNKTWDTKRRLKTWSNNNFGNNKNATHKQLNDRGKGAIDFDKYEQLRKLQPS